MQKEVHMLELEIEVKLKTKQEYGSKAVVDSMKRTILRVDSDASKRKIIDAMESEVESIMSEASRLVHFSSDLTDGEVARENEGKVN
jgi:hypothetical protein